MEVEVSDVEQADARRHCQRCREHAHRNFAEPDVIPSAVLDDVAVGPWLTMRQRQVPKLAVGRDPEPVRPFDFSWPGADLDALD